MDLFTWKLIGLTMAALCATVAIALLYAHTQSRRRMREWEKLPRPSPSEAGVFTAPPELPSTGKLVSALLLLAVATTVAVLTLTYVPAVTYYYP